MTFPTEWKVIKFHGSKQPTTNLPMGAPSSHLPSLVSPPPLLVVAPAAAPAPAPRAAPATAGRDARAASAATANASDAARAKGGDHGGPAWMGPF